MEVPRISSTPVLEEKTGKTHENASFLAPKEVPKRGLGSYMWLWIFLATLVSATFAANENLQSVIHPLDARNEFFVRLILLPGMSPCSSMALRQKAFSEAFVGPNGGEPQEMRLFAILTSKYTQGTMEEQHRAMFLTDNKNRRVSLSFLAALKRP